MSKYYMGIMCGTSLDSIDISIASFSKNKMRVIGSKSFKINNSLKKEIEKCKLKPNNCNKVNKTSDLVSKKTISSIKNTLSYFKIKKTDIHCIGFPGITLEHRPNRKKSTYLGDPKKIAQETSLVVVSDFRQCDIDAGGQGAPLSAFFHQYLNRSKKDFTTFINLGGFANITLKSGNKVFGFDTGPANYLLDLWCRKKFNKDFDHNGKLASKGNINPPLLRSLLNHKFFKIRPPKSTGFEDFNEKWLQSHLSKIKGIKKIDVLSTLTYFTIITVVNEINRFNPKSKNIYFCGGGSNNLLLVQGILSLSDKIRQTRICPGVDEKNLESLSFAWLSMIRKKSQKITNTTITGSRKSRLLGSIYR
ncbi:MAG: anhydro-N-acetylmuramic acid kinase [Pseudomonadota bacterium]|nr:anhydro-N-acetylmuramic acid kinase [Pseudomonadota bacterium]